MKDQANIEYEDRDGYLYAFVSGDKDSLAISMDYWKRVIDESRERGSRALLVEEDFPNQLGTTDMFYLASAISEMPTQPLRIAFRDQQAEHGSLNEFGETVAVNRGLTVRAFSSIEDAVNWLKS